MPAHQPPVAGAAATADAERTASAAAERQRLVRAAVAALAEALGEQSTYRQQAERWESALDFAAGKLAPFPAALRMAGQRLPFAPPAIREARDVFVEAINLLRRGLGSVDSSVARPASADAADADASLSALQASRRTQVGHAVEALAAALGSSDPGYLAKVKQWHTSLDHAKDKLASFPGGLRKAGQRMVAPSSQAAHAAFVKAIDLVRQTFRAATSTCQKQFVLSGKDALAEQVCVSQPLLGAPPGTPGFGTVRLRLAPPLRALLGSLAASASFARSCLSCVRVCLWLPCTVVLAAGARVPAGVCRSARGAANVGACRGRQRSPRPRRRQEDAAGRLCPPSAAVGDWHRWEVAHPTGGGGSSCLGGGRE